jgi:glycerate dehydrogenase
MEHVKYIVVAATGYNNIDVAAVKKRGIPVSNVSGYSIHSVAQHVFASIFALLNRHEYYDAEVKAGRWAKSPDFCFYDHTIFELFGKTMGIIGYGDIGRRVGDLALAFGMKVIVHTRDTTKPKPDSIAFVDLDTLLVESDFISLHCPLTVESNQMIRKENLQKMKPTAILINTGRGALINEMDLFYALDHGVIRAAALDVLSQEPPSLQNPLLNHPNCLVTPHIAWAGQDARKKLIQGIADNIKSYQDGSPMNIVV